MTAMAPPTSRSPAAQAGFSLMELLIAMMIIGLLAAIALPLLLSQQHKSRDAVAKQDARNVVAMLEECYSDKDDYRSCTSTADLRGAGVAIGSAAGQVDVSAPAAREYLVTAHSRSGTDFMLARVAAGGQERTCTPSGRGGCPDTGSW
jgi:type IV pilus assembly protein PilA